MGFTPTITKRAVGALLLSLCLGLIGCGQKGPLYLPEDKPAPENGEA